MAWVIGGLVGIAVIVVVLVSVELGARWWVRCRGVYHVFPPGLRLHLRPDRDVFPQLESFVRFEVNSEGERGDEVPRDADGGLYRILVAGGSQPEAYLLDQHTSWPGALQRLMRTPEHLRKLGARHLHVGSIARSGVGSEALDLILERVLPRYPRLQAIVILVGASDVLRWLEQGAPSSGPSSVRTSDVFRCHPEGPFRWKPNQLALVEVLRRARQRWLRPVQVHERAGHWIGKARAMRARARDVRTGMPDARPMLDHFALHFRRLLCRARTHADRVVVVRQPWFDKDYTPEEAAHMWHGGVGQAWRQELTTYYSFAVVSGLMALVDAKAAEIADELEVQQLNLMGVLENSLENYYDWLHLTPNGAHTVATAVAAAILRRPLPSASRSTVADRRVAPSARLQSAGLLSPRRDRRLPTLAADA